MKFYERAYFVFICVHVMCVCPFVRECLCALARVCVRVRFVSVFCACLFESVLGLVVCVCARDLFVCACGCVFCVFVFIRACVSLCTCVLFECACGGVLCIHVICFCVHVVVFCVHVFICVCV